MQMDRTSEKTIPVICCIVTLWINGFANVAWGAPQKGDPIPAFDLATVDGKTLNHSDLAKFDLAVLYFFSTKCQPCQAGLTQLARLQTKNRDERLLLVGVGKQGPEEIKGFVNVSGSALMLAAGSQAVLSAFDALHVHPRVYIIGPDARVLQVVGGEDASVPSLLASLAEKQQQGDHPSAARETYVALLEQGDRSGIARAGIGYSLLKEGKLASAESSFRELADNPDSQQAVKGQEGLAETYLQAGQLEKASQVVEAVLKQAPNRGMARLIKGKVLYRKGDKAAAEHQIVLASAEGAASDFAWQKAQAHYAQGNLLRAKKQPQIALASYKKAVEEDPYFADALSNQGVTLQEMGKPEEAAKVFAKLKQVHPGDRLAESLLRQAQAAIAQKQDLERQRYIDGLVKDLIAQFKKDQQSKPPAADDWTSPAVALSILGFQNRAGDELMERAGLDEVLREELTHRLQEANLKVVDRAILDKVLAELKMGASELADPDTALRVGRILAARLIATGSVFRPSPKEGTVNLRLVDTETTDIVLPLSERQGGPIDPATVATNLAKKISAAVRDKYPVKGRIALVEGGKVIINLGKKYGIQPGMVFNVLGDEKPVELNGRVLGYEHSKVGQLEVVSVEELMAYAKPLESPGHWEKNQKIILK